jgi:hypothetical protein
MAIDPRHLASGAALKAGLVPQAPTKPRKPPGSRSFEQARDRAWNSSPEIIDLKRTLTKAGQTVGSHRQWAALHTQLINCIPKNDRAARWSLSLSVNITLADEAAAKGDDATYQLAMRRLWTAMSLIDL